MWDMPHNPSPVDLGAAREAAVAAARGAGEIQRKAYGGRFAVRHKGAIDLLTEVDLACERHVVDTLLARFPDHGILAEEGGESGQGSPCRWVIDPLDGTTNFAHGLPFFCVSIGLEVAGNVDLGVVYTPLLDELFVAVRGEGATLNGNRLAVSGTESLVEALLVTGFAYDVHHAERDNLDHFAAFTRRAQATRRTGCAALDLSYVAAGRFDGFWELGLKPWDMAAGALFVTEAGGRVTRFDGSEHDPAAQEILATNGHLHGAMMEVLAGTPPV